MRERVKQTAREMGYKPNAIARQLREGHGKIMGLIVPRINRHFFANVIYGAELFAKQKGYQVLICQSHDSTEEELACLEVLMTQHVAGIAISLASDSTNAPKIQELIGEGTPVVMFDRIFPDLPVSKVTNSNVASSYAACMSLINQGYRQIVHLGGPFSMHNYQERFEGYQQALADSGLPLEPVRVISPCLTQSEGEKAIETLLATKVPFDAICAASDFSALGAKIQLEAQGLRIPQDIGITGFANEPFTHLLGITSVDQFSEEMGKQAAQLLLDQILNQAHSPTHITLPPKLMERASSRRTPD